MYPDRGPTVSNIHKIRQDFDYFRVLPYLLREIMPIMQQFI